MPSNTRFFAVSSSLIASSCGRGIQTKRSVETVNSAVAILFTIYYLATVLLDSALISVFVWYGNDNKNLGVLYVPVRRWPKSLCYCATVLLLFCAPT
jgi:hypothetical protein